MFQCKQEERELKRMESHVIKNERNLKKILKDYENGRWSGVGIVRGFP